MRTTKAYIRLRRCGVMIRVFAVPLQNSNRPRQWFSPFPYRTRNRPRQENCIIRAYRDSEEQDQPPKPHNLTSTSIRWFCKRTAKAQIRLRVAQSDLGSYCPHRFQRHDAFSSNSYYIMYQGNESSYERVCRAETDLNLPILNYIWHTFSSCYAPCTCTQTLLKQASSVDSDQMLQNGLSDTCPHFWPFKNLFHIHQDSEWTKT